MRLLIALHLIGIVHNNYLILGYEWGRGFGGGICGVASRPCVAEIFCDFKFLFIYLLIYFLCIFFIFFMT